MPCKNGTKWCPTPFGVKCVNCKNEEVDQSSPSSTKPEVTRRPLLPPRPSSPPTMQTPPHKPVGSPQPIGSPKPVSSPRPVSSPKSVVSEEEIAQGFTVYRGDTRDLENLRTKFGGQFSAWVPLVLSQARDFVKATGLNSLRTLSFFNDIESGRICIPKEQFDSWSPGACMEWKIRSGSGNKRMCILSTELTAACGGYANGYIYTIHIPDFQAVDWATAIPGCKIKQKGTTPLLMMDANTVDAASVMAIMTPKMVFTKEIAFFTSIPTSYIIDVKQV